MSDSGSGGGQLASELGETVKEVASEVKDAVGEMIEQGVQSVAGPTLTAQQVQQKQQEDQKHLVETRRKIAWYGKTDQEQKQVRQTNAQKEQQRLQSQQQEKVEKVQIVQVKQAKENNAAQEAARRSAAEFKAGKGVGG